MSEQFKSFQKVPEDFLDKQIRKDEEGDVEEYPKSPDTPRVVEDLLDNPEQIEQTDMINRASLTELEDLISGQTGVSLTDKSIKLAEKLFEEKSKQN